MPLYEYKCEKCKKTFEALQKINSEPLTECIHCRGPVNKLISLSSFQFKGSGWYITDYKDNKKQKKSAQTTSAAQPENGSKDKKKKKAENNNKDVSQN